MKQPFAYSAVLVAILSLFLVPAGCRIDSGGLGGEMAFLPHDGSANTDSPVNPLSGTAGDMGVAGGGGNAGSTGAAGSLAMGGSGGDAGSSGAAGDGTAGTGSAGLGGPGTAGSGSAGLGGPGTAGTGSAGLGGPGTAGVMGTAGTMGTAGAGTAGMMGTAGTTGAAGMMGTAGTTGAAGAPPPVCGPKTCPNGCCDGNACVAGRAANRCGNGGGACSTCGKCMLCTNAGACDVDPSSNWNIVCGQATLATSPPGGGTWDPHTASANGTNPDPFCEFEMPAGSLDNAGSTISQPDTFTGVWNTDVTPAGKAIKARDLTAASGNWRLWVGDDDGCTVRGGCVAQLACQINQPLPASALIAGQLVSTNLGSCVSLTVKFVCEN